MSDVGLHGLGAVVVFLILAFVSFLGAMVFFFASKAYNKPRLKSFSLAYAFLTCISVLLMFIVDEADGYDALTR